MRKIQSLFMRLSHRSAPRNDSRKGLLRVARHDTIIFHILNKSLSEKRSTKKGQATSKEYGIRPCQD